MSFRPYITIDFSLATRIFGRAIATAAQYELLSVYFLSRAAY